MPTPGAIEIASRRTGRLRQTCFVVGVPICRRSGGNPQLSTWTSLARRPSGVNNPGGFHRLEVSLLVIDLRGDHPCRTDRAAPIRFDSLNHKRDQEAPPMGVFHARSIFGASDKSKRPPSIRCRCSGPPISCTPFGWTESPSKPPDRVAKNRWTTTPIRSRRNWEHRQE